MKKSGADFDYSKKRYPWTEMSAAELEYCQNDVVGLLEAAVKKIHHDGDTLYSIPRTSTGYVRRDAKKALSGVCGIRSMLPSEDVYRELRFAFRGGDTHANRFYVGKILRGVVSVDRSSSYPDVMLNQKFPMSKFEREPDGVLSVVSLLERGRAVLCRIDAKGIQLRDSRCGNPYIPVAKCQCLANVVEDNGRVLSADTLAIYVTEIDIDIILDQYDGDFTFSEVMSSKKDYLPEQFREVVRTYYRNKTSLKGVEGQEYLYIKSKNLLNSLYGMCATDPGKDETIFSDGEYLTQKADFSKNIKKSFLPYQWGVWVTAHARHELYEMVKIAGNNFVYADTDSCKFLKNDKISFDAYNERCISNSTAHGAKAVDPKGKMHYMGVAESEGEYYKFITWGAKKYASEDADGNIKITIAGVRKTSSRDTTGAIVEWGGDDELKKAGGLEALKPGYVFHKAGGLESVYNDDVDKFLTIDGHKLHITRNVCLRPSTYELSITDEYNSLLSDINNILISVDADRYLCYDLFRA